MKAYVTFQPALLHGRGAHDPGRQIEVGRYRYAAGTGAKPHQHPEEQVINVLSGKLRVRVGGG